MSNKTFIEKGKWLTNGSKIVASSLAIITNIINFLIYKEILSYEKQQSLLLLCGFVVLIFLPIDFSIIVKNFIKNKIGD